MLPDTMRPLGVPVAASSERAGGSDVTGVASSGGAASRGAVPAVPLPIQTPDDWDVWARISKLETHVAELESVLSMCVQVATTAASRPVSCACCSALDAIAEVQSNA